MNEVTGSTPTISDVARLAGVSKRTVSRVLNGSAKVNPETRKEIQRIIKELHYEPSPQARGLATRRSYLIGLLYDDPNALFIHAIQRGILSVCLDAGYELVVHPCDHLNEKLPQTIKRFVTRSKIDGLIVLPPISSNRELLQTLARENYNYVSIAAQLIDEPARVVISEDRSAMHQLADHLVSLGHRNIGFITGPSQRMATIERLGGFRDSLSRHGITLAEGNLIQGDFSFESGIRCGLELLRRHPAPTAIFAANDEMAVGVIHAAHQLGIRVPEQLSVAGYDDSPLASRSLPPLTTFHRHNERLAVLATEKLLKLINDGGRFADQQETVLHPELFIRQSTGPCPKP